MHCSNYERQKLKGLIISLITGQETENALRDTQISRTGKLLKQTFYLNSNLGFISRIHNLI